MRNGLAMVLVTVAFLSAPSAFAQDAEAPPPVSESGSDTAQVVTLPSNDEVIDVAAIALPDLAFKADPQFEKDFDKYYYFHRDNTEFRAALSDLRDCDGLSRGLASPYGYQSTYSPSLAGAAGGVIGNLLVAAIFGSGQVRATRRINMRRCMNFKGYQRFGLPKDVWQEFNFEEGFSELNEAKRQVFLKQQAKVASGARPATEVLGK